MEHIKGTLNRVELIGWVGAEPEQRFLPSGTAVCNFNIATKRWAGRGDDGTRTVETDWTPIEAWEKLAETCGRYLHKGRRIRITGSLHTRSWEDRETGQKRSKTVVRAEEILFLDARPEQEDEAEAVAVAAEDLPF
ncbi:MAG TPA: single-stranded DNA-binding protein [Roseiflexaceae bacterium]